MNCSPRRAARLCFAISSRLGLRRRFAPPRRLPVGIVLLHHAQARGQGEAAEGSAEAAEAMAVAGADQQEVVVAHVLGLRVEVKRSSSPEFDPVQSAEADRRRLDRLAVDPDCPLAALWRIVDSLHQVPGENAALDRFADAGRPEPVGVALVVAGGLVVESAAADLPATARHLHGSLDGHPGPLAGPGEAAAAGAGHFDRSDVAQLEAGAQPGTVDLPPRPVEPHLAAAGKWVGVDPLLPSLAVPQDPERLRHWS